MYDLNKIKPLPEDFRNWIESQLPPEPIFFRTDLSSSERRKRETRTEFVWSVMSKQSTALPRFWSSRLVTATTSPSRQTRPDSSVSVSMGMGLVLTARPKMTSPWGAPPCCVFAAGAAAGGG